MDVREKIVEELNELAQRLRKGAKYAGDAEDKSEAYAEADGVQVASDHVRDMVFEAEEPLKNRLDDMPLQPNERLIVSRSENGGVYTSYLEVERSELAMNQYDEDRFWWEMRGSGQGPAISAAVTAAFAKAGRDFGVVENLMDGGCEGEASDVCVLPQEHAGPCQG